MASPISGDKILTQRDVNPSQTGRRQASERTEGQAENERKAALQDSVELKTALQDTQPRPLSDTVQNTGQAQDKLAQLLGAMRENPSRALAAQGGIGQAQGDALLSHSA